MLKERREKMQASGKKGCSLIKRIVEEPLPHFPWLTRNMVHHFITTYTYTDENMVPIVIQTKHQTVVSGLTNLPSPVSAATRSATEPITTTELVATMEPVFTTEDGVNTEVTSPASTNTYEASNKGGHQHESTQAAIKASQSVYKESLYECTIEVTCIKALALERTQKLGKKRGVPRGAFEKTIKKVRERYKLTRHEIHLSAVLIRNKEGHKLKVEQRGAVSPMSGIEADLLGIILRRVALRQPVSCAEGLELANSLIDWTQTQVDLMEWGKKHLKMGKRDTMIGNLGTRY
jgi:hypothetical protein